jgi:hypothetical protein
MGNHSFRNRCTSVNGDNKPYGRKGKSTCSFCNQNRLKRTQFYGIIESVAGILKILLLIGTFIVMITINTGGTFPGPDPS